MSGFGEPQINPPNLAGPGLNGISKTLLAPLKRIKAASAVRHSVRILTILAKASFWAVCYHYFGPKTLLYVVASWTFLLGIKDMTFARVRLSSIKNPKKRNRAYAQSGLAEVGIIAVRVGAVFALAKLLTPFNKDVAATIPILAIAAGFWARETFITIGSAFHTGSLRIYVSLAASLAALGSIVFFAESGFDPIHSAIWAMMIREGLSFFGFAGVALLGCLGFRTEAEADDDDDEDGGEAVPILAPDGREVRSAWKVLIADNVIYSRWRMMHFAARFVAHGVLGPFGGIIARIFFSYRKPGAYEHHKERLPVGKIIAMAVAAATVISAIVYVAERAGMLHAVGIAAAGFLFRVVALSLNLLMWRQLSPIVGAPRKSRVIDQTVVISQGTSPASPSTGVDKAE